MKFPSLSSFRWAFAVVLAFGSLLAFGWGEGIWTGRWQPSDAGRLAAAKLKDVPMQIGAWEGAEGEFDERQMKLAELDGYLYRIYTNVSTGQQVQMLVVCGRPGPISVHTPDVCYRGLGFSTLTSPLRKSLVKNSSGSDAMCWTAEFQRPSIGGKEYLKIAWSWFANGAWHAADQPRFEFAQEPVLYKMYLIHPVAKPDLPWDEDSIPQFSSQAVPVLTTYLAEREANSDIAGP